jgi:polysaccharide export outer membrane protein
MALTIGYAAHSRRSCAGWNRVTATTRPEAAPRFGGHGKTLVLVAFGVLSLLLTACSTPGRNFSGSLPSSKVKQQYNIKAITPELLVKMAESRKQRQNGVADLTVKQAIDDYTYRVGPQDVLNVVIWDHPELTLPQGEYRSAKATGFIVQSDGTIAYPYVGTMQVAGKTTSEIRRQLAKALKPYVKNPQVDVKVVGFHSKTFQLAGAVAKPGLYPVTNVPLTVAQALAKTGGVLRMAPTGNQKNVIPRSLADLSHVILVRDGRRIDLNLRAFYRHGDQGQNRLIQAGDIIQVPDNGFEQIHLIGEVRDPGNYPMNHGELNLAQLLGDAGGLNLASANAGRILVFRGAYQQPRVFWLNSASPDAMLLATQFELQPQDVVYVATAGVSSWNRIVTQILPTVQALYETKVLVHPR